MIKFLTTLQHTEMKYLFQLNSKFIPNKFKYDLVCIQSAQKCGSNFYTKCHKMALSKSQIFLQSCNIQFLNFFKRIS
jgi:hypothetical protein